MSGRGRNHRVLLAVVTGIVAAGVASAWLVLRHRPASMPTATCGRMVTLHGSSGTQVFEQDAGALTCFRRAAASCHSASLLVADQGADSGTLDVVALRLTRGVCSARVTEQSYNLDWKSTIRHFDCGHVVVGDQGETVLCDAGVKFSIPVTAAWWNTSSG